MTAPSIVNVSPANGANGIILSDTIVVLFDQEMDETSIDSGTFIIVGPTKDFIFGRDFNPLDFPGVEDEQILNTPYTEAYVEGVYTFERINPSALTEIDVQDTTGAGNLYRTRVTFTPDKPFEPNVLYKVILAGDENASDSLDTGVKTRSVFDTVETVIGTGSLDFYGTYTGNATTTYKIEITSGGTCGTAEYIWWDDNDPLTTYPGITTTGRRQIEKGVYVVCDPDGAFTVGDTFSVVCKPPSMLTANYKWSFTTGSGSIAIPPSSSSTSGIDELLAVGSGDLEIVSMTPVHRATNLELSTFTQIEITFNKNIDASTVTDSTITLWSEPVNGDSSISAQGTLAKVISVSGKIITIEIQS